MKGFGGRHFQALSQKLLLKNCDTKFTVVNDRYNIHRCYQPMASDDNVPADTTDTCTTDTIDTWATPPKHEKYRCNTIVCNTIVLQ